MRKSNSGSVTAKTSARLLAAASIGMSGLMIGAIFVNNQGASETTAYAAAENVAESSLQLPAGFDQVELKDASGIKTGLVKMTERAVTKGDYNSLLAELALQDRERARELKNPDQARLDADIGQIQNAWKAKYNEDFAINDKNLVFDDHYTIVQGKVSDPSAALNDWPVAAAPGMSSGNGAAMPAADTSNNAGIKQQISDAKLGKGRDVALVQFPGIAGMQPLTVSMIFHYPMFWRVDVPNDRTGEQIFNDLSKQLHYIAEHQDQWPADRTEAYRMVAYHVAAALYGTPADMRVGQR